MFKKMKIAVFFAVMLGLISMSAQAVTVNGSGSHGQVLIFPYYNVNNGYVTTYNLINTTNAYKAVKIRFRESENSNDVLDFNLYLSPHDMFSMQLSNKADSGVLLKTSDRSCTYPTIPANGVLFRHTAYDSTSVEDVREGYLEVIEMGEIDQRAYVLNDSNQPQLIASQGVLHSQPTGIPFDCDVIDKAWVQGVFVQGGAASNGVNNGGLNWVNPKPTGYPLQNIPSDTGFYGQSSVSGFDNSGVLSTERSLYSKDVLNSNGDPMRAITPPKGGLVGASILIDLRNISGFAIEPVAIVSYSTIAQHYLSSDENFYLLPSLASGSVLISEHTDGTVATYNTVVRDWGMDDIGVLPKTSVPSGINPMPISDAMLITTLGNQYFLGQDVSTDLVVSAPMRKHGIYNNYKYIPANSSSFSASNPIPEKYIPVGMTSVDMSLSEKTALANTNGYWANVGAVDVNATVIYYDREEGSVVAESGDFSPPITTPNVEVPFEREVNVLSLYSEFGSIGGDDSVLGSDNAQTFTLVDGFTDGWVEFGFTNSEYQLRSTSGDSSRYEFWGAGGDMSAKGVPLHGFMAARGFVNNGHITDSIPHFHTLDR